MFAANSVRCGSAPAAVHKARASKCALSRSAARGSCDVEQMVNKWLKSDMAVGRKCESEIGSTLIQVFDFNHPDHLIVYAL